MLKPLIYTLVLGLRSVSASTMPRAAAPTVKLDNGTFTGNASSTGLSNQFLGIPFAKPPTGDLRFRLPVPVDPYNTSQTVNSFGDSCPQQATTLPNGTLPTGPQSEDCLTINVVTPANATANSKLPVAVWIYGGAFEEGASSGFDGTSVVERSIAIGEPVVYVSMNYRVTAFGFLAGQEVNDAGVGNIGLEDQREAFRWVQKYIRPFGGDPSKVTIWGESAGSISVALQMLTNGGNPEGLFRGAFMQSGSPTSIDIGDVSTGGQTYFDFITEQTGCSNEPDKLDCLRGVSYSSLKAAIDQTPSISSYQAVDLAWLPRVDGRFLTDGPQVLMQKGQVARIPMVNGDCDDEGTVFTLSTLNITTTDQLSTYISEYLAPNIDPKELESLEILYPQDPAQGSPFDTGDSNAITPQFKRTAAIIGDILFQGPRRLFLKFQSGKQPIWSYVHKRGKSTPTVGASHGSDIPDVYLSNSSGPTDMADQLIYFVNKLDPNGGTHIKWPQYTTASPNMMTYLDGTPSANITQDTYRVEGIALSIQIISAQSA